MPADREFELRQQRLRELLPSWKADSALITSLPNVRYLTGFTGSNGMVLVAERGVTLFTDPRYTIQAGLETSCAVKIAKGPIQAAAVAAITRHRCRRIAFERDRIPFHLHDYVGEKLPGRSRLVPAQGLVDPLRMVKSEQEIAAIRQAVATNSAAFAEALKLVRPGMTETELAAELEYRMRRHGAEGPSFDTIVASGTRAALPHARPGAQPVLADRLLLIDMGATRGGYTSDMTRTVFLGTPGAFWKRAYRAVLEAQLAGIAAIRPGVAAAAPDRAARQVLAKHGLDKEFTHSTGHGLGLEIHEPPRLGRREKQKLRPGMVVTVEPGVYLEGKGGIRIEDTVLVTETGCEILTPTSKELTII